MCMCTICVHVLQSKGSPPEWSTFPSNNIITNAVATVHVLVPKLEYWYHKVVWGIVMHAQ